MKDWDPGHYLKFRSERTQPSIDLVGKIHCDLPPENIIDIGCGPGNNTQVLKQRWPNANVLGIDNSPNMINKAKAEYPDMHWHVADIATFETDQKFDLVYSNATIQWIPNHEELLPKMATLLRNKGIIAVQIPQFRDMPIGQTIDIVSKKEQWNYKVAHCRNLFTYNPYTIYYDILARFFTKIEMWETFYLHEMESHEAIIDMVKSAGMKPYMDALLDENEKENFAQEILSQIKLKYPTQKNGNVLFPFKRLFFVGYRK